MTVENAKKAFEIFLKEIQEHPFEKAIEKGVIDLHFSYALESSRIHVDLHIFEATPEESKKHYLKGPHG